MQSQWIFVYKNTQYLDLRGKTDKVKKVRLTVRNMQNSEGIAAFICIVYDVMCGGDSLQEMTHYLQVRRCKALDST